MSRKFKIFFCSAVISCVVFLIAATQATAAFNDYSMLFDGVDEYIELGTNLFEYQNFTVSAWFYQKGDGAGTFSGIVENADTYDGGKGWIIVYVPSNNKIRFYVWDGVWQYAESVAINNDQWYHIVCVADGGTVTIYLDSAPSGTTDTYGTLTYENTNTARIGIYGVTSWSMFYGNIDEASIWNKALSSNEVSEIWNNGYPGNLLSHSAETNLVSWWRMGDGGSWGVTNWTIPDLKSSNDGISTNMEYSDRSQEVPPAPPSPSGTMFMCQ